ncbi:THUMP domain-containing class I SAM-dependent RNA methyltransferase [Spirochaeta africana]|uniref:Putative N6-adenine-specific DNA methylase n=1 Tax=Spirochaeta africana (strain ATCC 700263 / DSM 8902 / Z-7692) TaxID=889378 RepID=H9UJ46_SPIAZ|nr:class I SAM-dependent RNA methyltransferase [Spirochaeta africana]AFG37539.1 putative N6-adenine-specific DNA methylase [Spirochaeta africana DSM 8902]
MKILQGSFPLQVVPLPQFAELALREVESLGVAKPRIEGSIITGYTDWEAAYRCIYQARLAMRVLAPLTRTSIRTKDELYAAAAAIEWGRLITPDTTFAVDVQGQHAEFSRLGYAALVVKDAVVDRCRTADGVRPSVDTANPDLRIHLYLSDRGSSVLSLDIGHGSLHRRGYRSVEAPAPLNEVLAASILEYAGYAPRRPLLDPFCGYGTILMEAAMRLLAVPAGYFRTPAFQPDPDWGNPVAWQRVRSSALEQMDRRCQQAERSIREPVLFGGDIDEAAVHSAERTLQRLPLGGIISSFEVRDAMQLICPRSDIPGLVVTNPPYDERVKTPDTAGLYRGFSLQAKQVLPDWSVHVVTGSETGAKAFALRTRNKLQVYNGQLRCTLLSADILPPKKLTIPRKEHP